MNKKHCFWHHDEKSKKKNFLDYLGDSKHPLEHFNYDILKSFLS